MKRYLQHLYAITYPNTGLVASQMAPAEFASSYAVGSARFYEGKMLFFEVDLEFRHPYFEIDRYLEQTVEHPDGRPKRTKFISSYRVLEHLSLDALRGLYAMAVSGPVLKLEREEAPGDPESEPIRLYQELAPSGLLYATKLGPAAFVRHVTAPDYPKGAPGVFFTQYRLDVNRFREAWETNPFISAPIDGLHPHKLKLVLDELAQRPEVKIRSVGLESVFRGNSYRRIQHGFWIGKGERTDFYRLPSEAELRSAHETWLNAID